MIDLNSSEARKVELKAIKWKVSSRWVKEVGILPPADNPESGNITSRQEALLTSSPGERLKCVLEYAGHIEKTDPKEFEQASQYIAAAMAREKQSI